MSPMILVAFLALAELLLIAIGLIVLLFLRLRTVSREARHLARLQAKAPEPFDPFSYFTQAIKNTEAQLDSADNHHAGELRVRLCYLQAELSAVAQNDYLGFWQNLYKGLTPLLPSQEPVLPVETGQSVLAELDDPEPMSSTENEIPTLESPIKLAQAPSNEVIRLRKLIGRQHQAIEDLKQVLQARSLSEADAQLLEKSIQDVEVAHAQLNLGLDSIERVNSRLHNAITTSPEPMLDNEAAAELAAEFDVQETLSAEEIGLAAINAAEDAVPDEELVVDADALFVEDDEPQDMAAQIQSLTQEIAELAEHLQQRSADLLRLESLDMDLAHDEETDEVEDPGQVRAEIEVLSEMLVARRDELAQLVSDQVIDLQASAANDDSAEASFPEVDWDIALHETAVDEWTDAATEQAELVAASNSIVSTNAHADDDSAGFPEINWDDAIAEIDTDPVSVNEEEVVAKSDDSAEKAEEEIDIDALLAEAEGEEDDSTPLVPDIDELNYAVASDSAEDGSVNQHAKS